MVVLRRIPLKLRTEQLLHFCVKYKRCWCPFYRVPERGSFNVYIAGISRDMTTFDVLLTVHLSLISVINQLNSQILVL